MYKLNVSDRNYHEHKIFLDHSMEETNEININPNELKMFNQDVFNYNKEDGSVEIIHSMVKFTDSIPGVLVLEDNKTYGKIKDKFYYKCIPDDKRLPYFIVGYKLGGKKGNIGFHKNIKNKFIIFKFVKWEDKHPIGELVNVIGDVDVLENFYEYQLYRKSLHTSINEFTQYTLKKLKECSEEGYIDAIMKKYPSIIDCRDRNIYTIDPHESRDFDDGFSINVSEEYTTISIYIANVYMWFDILDLWKAFSNRISTIYLPDRKRPMLPNVLSDSLCSLKESCNRFTFVIDIDINSKGEIINHKIYNALINVKKNYIYDSEELQENDDYLLIHKIIKRMNRVSKYISDIVDSHDVIAYLMTVMNYYCAQELIKSRSGIFRGFTTDKIYKPPEHLDDNIRKFLQYTRGSGGLYELFSDNIRSHDILEMDAYINITSPIRRLIDLLNMMVLMQHNGLITMNSNSYDFLKYWLDNIDYINKCMKSIKKIQIDCKLLDICSKDPELYNKTFKGCIFDRIIRSDGLFQYNIYLPDLKMLNRFVSRNSYENFSMNNFRLYLFKNKENLRHKIRLEVI